MFSLADSKTISDLWHHWTKIHYDSFSRHSRYLSGSLKYVLTLQRKKNSHDESLWTVLYQKLCQWESNVLQKSLYVLFSSHCFWRKYCVYWYELKFELHFLLPGNNVTIIKKNLEKETSLMKGESYTYLWT